MTNTKDILLTEDGKVTLVLKTPRNNEKTYENATESTKPKDLNDFKQTASVTKPTLEYQSPRNEMYAEYVNQLKNFRIRKHKGIIVGVPAIPCQHYSMPHIIQIDIMQNQ